MKDYELKEIVTKIIGEIKPVGDSNIDGQRIENLKELLDFTDELITEIQAVARYKNDDRHSCMKAGRKAKEWLIDLEAEIGPFRGQN